MLFDRAATTLHCQDFGGSGPPVLLLHGLAGYAGEWQHIAEHLIADHRVFALDQRGHGDSKRTPLDVSRDAYVQDTAETVRRIQLGPVTLVGQSMIEGSPGGPEPPDPAPAVADQIRQWLCKWPVPFADAATAQRFFAGQGLDPIVWTGGLEHRAGALWPRFDLDTLVGCMAELGSRSYWQQWRSIQCPTLVILGERGIFPAEHGEQIVRQLPGSTLAVIAGAGHDVHLDAPKDLAKALRTLTTADFEID